MASSWRDSDFRDTWPIKDGRWDRSRNFADMEKVLLEEILRRREEKLSITMKEIQQQLALEYTKRLYPNEKFLASNGWFWKFCRRYKLSRRTATHVITKACEHFELIVDQFFKVIRSNCFKVEGLKSVPNKRRIVFLNLDEQPLCYDLSSKKTYTPQGEKDGPIKTTTGGSNHATVVLRMTDKPLKLPVLLIIKNPAGKAIELESPLHDHLIMQQTASSFINEEG